MKNWQVLPVLCNWPQHVTFVSHVSTACLPDCRVITAVAAAAASLPPHPEHTPGAAQAG